MELGGATRELLIFLAAAGIVVPLFSRLRLGVVLGFLVAGMALGPQGLGRFVPDAPWLGYITFDNDERVAPFAELGILFLLFTVGLELSADRLWAMRRLVFGAGLAQMLVTAGVVMVVLLWLGSEVPAGMVIGLGLAFSSTAIVLQILIEARRLGTDVGRTALSVLLLQDLMVVPGVILITVFSADTQGGVLSGILRSIGLAVAAIGAILLIGRYLLGPLLRAAAATRSREIILALALLTAIGSAAGTAAAGLSPALGAFLAGLLFGSGPYRHQVEVDIEPFKGLLLGLFFMTVGMGVDLTLIIRFLPQMIIGVLGLIAAKALINYGVLQIFGVRRPAAVESAIILAGAGEFAFALFTLARQEGLMTWDDLRFVTAIAAISMVATPILAVFARRLGNRLERGSGGVAGDAPIVPAEFKEHVIIGGFGRVGETVARILESAAIPYVAVDLDAARVAAAQEAGRQVHFGDISRQEILERLGGGRATAFVITSDLPAETERTVATIARNWPGARIYARAKDARHAAKLRTMGALDVVPEAVEASLQLAARVLGGVGVPDDAVATTIETARAGEAARLSAAAIQ